MAEHRPFPPTPRRHALARQAGLTAASPVLVGSAACVAAVVIAVAAARSAAAAIGGWIAAACDGRAALAPHELAHGRAVLAPHELAHAHAALAPHELAHGHAALAPHELAHAVLVTAAPLVGLAAAAALLVHLAQTRAPWLPRRRIRGAPALARGPGARTARASLELTSATALAGVALGWLWVMAPRLAQLFELSPRGQLAAAAALLSSLTAALAATWVVAGAVDALMRRAGLARALRMTAAEKREDDRAAAADPRWRARRAALAREPAIAGAVAGAALVVLGDDAAVAIAWHPTRQPIPQRAAAGRGVRATQLLALARRYRIPVHRDPALAAELAARGGAIPERAWPRLAEIVAAVGPPP